MALISPDWGVAHSMEITQKDIPDILIVDDIDTELFILNKMIEKLGYRATLAHNAQEAIESISNNMPQLILLDIVMPDINGYQLCEMLKDNQATRNIPVIFTTAMDNEEDKNKAFELGCVDYICKPYDYVSVRHKVETHLKIYSLQRELEDKNKRLSMIISEQSKKYEDEQKRVLKAIAKFAEENQYKGMKTHVDSVAYNARLLAQALNFTDKYDNKISNAFIESIEIAATVHDIGKITIPASVVNKDSQLTEEETELVRSHTTSGEKILKTAYPDIENNKFTRMAADVIRWHHENWDGSGYPDGKKGEDIPLAARIIKIVDTYDCLLAERPYRKAIPRQTVLDMMEKQKGIEYDPYLLDVFMKIERQMKH